MLRELRDNWGLGRKDAVQAGLTGSYLALFLEPLVQLQNPLDWSSLSREVYRPDRLAWLFSIDESRASGLCDQLITSSDPDTAEPCPICGEPLLERGRPLSGRERCPHLFHTDCLQRFLNKKDKDICPLKC